LLSGEAVSEICLLRDTRSLAAFLKERPLSGFLSFLKKIGQVIAAGLELTGFISPAVLPLFGSGKAGQSAARAVNDFTSIGTTIIQIEAALQGKPGAEKLAAASTLVAPIVRTSELVSGHQIANESEFIAGCTDLTNAAVRILNSLKPDNIKTTGDPLNAPPAAPAVPTEGVSP
jgi:hypothetical protein